MSSMFFNEKSLVLMNDNYVSQVTQVIKSLIVAQPFHIIQFKVYCETNDSCYTLIQPYNLVWYILSSPRKIVLLSM